ncbi:hypothetical protein ACFVAQ_41960, partial [Streptomyces sp. NPDC057651]|uniref:hypothetical protein n=1 Tax=Streptomyces sp. NPDC057651 TaxID=3346194 RepID=UPI00369BAE7F
MRRAVATRDAQASPGGTTRGVSAARSARRTGVRREAASALYLLCAPEFDHAVGQVMARGGGFT